MLANPAVRCLIVDDSADFVDAARRLLEREGIMVVGVASTAAQALRRCEESRPDVGLVDVELGGESGFELAEQLQMAAWPAPVILVSTHAAADFADAIAASPAVGFISKSDLTNGAILTLAASSAGLKYGDHR